MITRANAEKQQAFDEACKWKNQTISLQKRLDEMNRAAQDHVTWEQHSEVLRKLYTLASSVTEEIRTRIGGSEELPSDFSFFLPTLSEPGVNEMPWPHPQEQSDISGNPVSTENTSSMLSMLQSPSPVGINPRLTMH